ncbi:MAG: DUF2760 domain-containing protein [Planctomycetaceae bacterium]|nr:DUF2760 domain-containing protein [Planctomycetaceae bacterium]
MGRIGLAFRSFFGVLFQRETAERVGQAMSGAVPRLEQQEPAVPVKAAAPPKSKPKPKRSDALTLLEALQREARFIDFIQESLDGYDDAQVGAAVREVHRGTRSLLNRFFELKAVVPQEEGSMFEVTAEEETARVRLIGNVPESRPVKGELVHAGWQATQCELPQWTGAEASMLIIAPAEVEVR